MPGKQIDPYIAHLAFPERQGARLRRLWKKHKLTATLGRLTGSWITGVLGFSKNGSENLLYDHYGWKKKNVEAVALASGIPFKDLWIPNYNTIAKKYPKYTDVISSDQAMIHFWGSQLDTEARDFVIAEMLAIKQTLTDNKEVIKSRQQRKRKIETTRIVVDYILKKIAKENSITPANLLSMKQRHGSFLQFQDRYDELVAMWVTPKLKRQLKAKEIRDVAKRNKANTWAKRRKPK